MSDVSPESMSIVGRRRGRPRVGAPKSTVSTRIPVEHHDHLVRLAKQRDVSVSCVVRALIRERVSKSS